MIKLKDKVLTTVLILGFVPIAILAEIACSILETLGAAVADLRETWTD